MTHSAHGPQRIDEVQIPSQHLVIDNQLKTIYLVDMITREHLFTFDSVNKKNLYKYEDRRTCRHVITCARLDLVAAAGLSGAQGACGQPDVR